MAIRSSEIIRYARLIIPAIAAFSPYVRKIIFARDNGECQVSGKRFDEGWMMHCSHFNHDRSSPYYNSPENGQLEGIREHLFDTHWALFEANPSRENMRAIELLTTMAYAKGYHTDEYYADYPDQLGLDRLDLEETYEQMGEDVYDWIDYDLLEERYGLVITT
jgi:hypothetical protein